ncbi:flagellum-associated coiled-coil domain-containing protein 1 isoform X2 [Spea bombifrons]|uniref:flagellum-associated coiled-coil domain-containing protein 1 isoform X2 n=1 Tax=Spea bombifrons TaxID=233779 RepID=UPI00234A35A6|nr:flagellum-associated coiled-coil domain-containing protein 1 isoform X2 [Spea bombifrons]
MSDCINTSHTCGVTPRYRSEKQSMDKPTGHTNRPRTSPAVYTPFIDPGRDLLSAELSSYARKRVSPRLSSSRKMNKKAVQSQLEYLVISPGYKMMRSKEHIAVRLEEDFFGKATHPVEEKPPVEERPPRQNVRAAHQRLEEKLDKQEQSLIRGQDIIEDFQEQISKLTALLEQETTEHQKTQRRLTQELEERITELKKKNEEQICNLQKKYADDLHAVQKEKSSKLEQEKAEAENKFDELQKDFDLLKSSFRTYQESLSEELNESWLQKEALWKETSENDKLEALRKQRESLLDTFEDEKKELKRRAMEEMAMFQQSHEKQLNESWRKYKDILQESKMQDIQKTHLQAELGEKKEVIISLNAEIRKAHVQIGHLKSQLDDLKRSFEHRVIKVEGKYSHRIHTLLNENADLRRKLITKNEQLFSDRNQCGTVSQTTSPLYVKH